MKTLNLVDKRKSEIEYDLYQFPDGQQQVVIRGIKGTDFNLEEDNYNDKLVPFNETNFEEKVRISSRMNSFRDLEVIICATKSLRELGFKTIDLYVPYFLGSRSDRKFEEGSNNYLKTVICPIVNSLNFSSVKVIDPHSDVLEACLNNFNKLSNTDLVIFALKYNIYNTINAYKGIRKYVSENCILISPDAGSNKKVNKLAEEIGYEGEIITCSKSRDIEGKLTKTFVPLNATLLDKDFVIIDDICDGGATFINVAKEIKKWDTTNSCKIYLIVTHGIFSKGFSELNKYFDGIYCTNSYSNVGNKNVKVLDVF